ncbi:MAG TPA: outer membrane beta-barrel protein [Verrucomicrobiae bacterium]|nr:outer membrane beta-barrel protein [Verrucomicrobiae bacterium]
MTASLALAEERPSPVIAALSSTTLAGYIDASMHWNPGTGNANPAPYSFNAGKQDGFNLNAIDLSLEKALDDGQWSAGYKVELFLGPDAAFVNGSASSPVRQAYVAARLPIGNGVEFQAGRFDDLTGYEATDKWKNPNYTHSYGWSIEPTKHTGVVGSYSFNDSVRVKLGVANTWTTGPINARALRGPTLATAHQADDRKTIVSLVSLNAPASWRGLGGSSFFISANNGYGSITRDETYHGTGKDDGDKIRRCVVSVFIERDDEDAVVLLRPDKVSVQNIGFQPGVGLRDGAVVHVVLFVGNDEGHRGKTPEASRSGADGLERGERLVDRRRQEIAGGIRVVHPVGHRVVLALILVLPGNRGGGIAVKAGEGQSFGIGGKAVAGVAE